MRLQQRGSSELVPAGRHLTQLWMLLLLLLLLLLLGMLQAHLL